LLVIDACIQVSDILFLLSFSGALTLLFRYSTTSFTPYIVQIIHITLDLIL